MQTRGYIRKTNRVLQDTTLIPNLAMLFNSELEFYFYICYLDSENDFDEFMSNRNDK